jgi:broad specificity phosphatase PhoE
MSNIRIQKNAKSPTASSTAYSPRANLENSFSTPEKTNKTRKPLLRRRSDGSPILPRDEALPAKTVYMIRHGHSQGQAASLNGLDRKTCPSLNDCGLTEKGITQAWNIPQQLLAITQDPTIMESIQLVISSPLTRALHTALLGFPHHDVLVHYDLREIGSKVPENNPRDMSLVLNDLKSAMPPMETSQGDDQGNTRTSTRTIDVTTLQPDDWPRDVSPNVIKRDRLRKVLQWLYHERAETTLAVVCHFNVIRSAVCNGKELNVRPANAMPLCCQLYSNGDLILIEAVEEE